jgi:hypothetical protein
MRIEVLAILLGVAFTAAQNCGNQTSVNVTQAAINSWIYGLAPLSFQRTRAFYLNAGTPINKVIHARALATAGQRSVVRPNADTLYSIAFLDLSHGPLVLHLPTSDERFFVAAMYDAYTNNFKNPGNLLNYPAGNYTLFGPGQASCYNASNIFNIVSPTNDVWLLGRTYVLNATSQTDLEKVFSLQDDLFVASAPAPVETFIQPGFTNQTAQIQQSYYLLNQAVQSNPLELDVFASNYSSVGFSANRPFTSLLTLQELNAAQRAANQTIRNAPTDVPNFMQKLKNNWTLPAANIGNWGKDYLSRAYVATELLAAVTPEQALYPSYANLTSTNTSTHRIRFANGAPPTSQLGFWSFTAYDSSGFLVENALGRYSIGSRDALQKNADGSFDLLASVQPPVTGTSNWIPVPVGVWIPTLRIYGATNAIADGSWTPPAISLVDA